MQSSSAPHVVRSLSAPWISCVLIGAGCGLDGAAAVAEGEREHLFSPQAAVAASKSRQGMVIRVGIVAASN
jgi:hypothetical protein